MIRIVVPSLGESVSEAGIARWLVKEGDVVKLDQELCEIESDKANLLIPAPSAGRLIRILKKVGDTVGIGEVIGELEAGDFKPTAPVAPAAAEGNAAAAPVVVASADVVSGAGDRPLSPAVRRITEESNVNPADVVATGPGGRLLKGDVIQHLENRAFTPASAAPVSPAVSVPMPAPPAPRPAPGKRADEDRIERVRMSRLRKTVAERLVHAQQTAAILTTFNEVDMGAVMEMRKQYNDTFQAKYGLKLGFMSFFIKACIEALKEFPGVNAEIDGDDILYKRYFDIGVAVGGGKGLVVPVIRNADRLSFAEIEKTIAELGKKAKDGKLTPDDLSGGTFTLSNGGIYGSMMSTPILNYPQTGILGMHNIKNRPMEYPVGSGQIALRPMMYLALSYDHRVIDGREAVSFLVRVKDCIERPERMLLEV